MLLHGFLQTHIYWDAVRERLLGDYKIVRPDLRGYGAAPPTLAADRRITAPVLVLWQEPGGTPAPFDPLAIRRRWADVTGHALDAGRSLPEERPDEVAAALRELAGPSTEGHPSQRFSPSCDGRRPPKSHAGGSFTEAGRGYASWRE